MTSQPRPGYTLPVFACAAAVAALNHLKNNSKERVEIDLIEPPQTVKITIEQVALIGEKKALAITCSDPGDNLDITRNTPIWALVELMHTETDEQIIIKGGEGIGKQLNAGGKDAIYNYAKRLLKENLQAYLKPGENIQVTIILPEGRRLAERTSNAAFGVLEGLSLLGTTGISQPLSAPSQLAAYQAELANKAEKFDDLVFCVGENGLDLAQKLGINPEKLIKTANWLGPMLVAAGLQQFKSIVLFGYHGKLIKLAGGIFHTHHHLADGRLEILTAYLAQLGLSAQEIQKIFKSPTTEAALKLLREWDQELGSNWVEKGYGAIAAAIDQRSQEYIRNLSDTKVLVGSVLFDGERKIIVKSENGTEILAKL